MSNLTDFFPSGGGGLTPKFEEFNSSGTFTPTQALIDAGGYIEVFLVAGGGRGGDNGSGGGETILSRMYLSSTTGCTVTIGSGATTNSGNGSNSVFSGSSAGGVDLTAVGGQGNGLQQNKMGATWGSNGNEDTTAGSGVLGYGAGGVFPNGWGGVYSGKANSGQGSRRDVNGGSGFCLIKWYE